MAPSSAGSPAPPSALAAAPGSALTAAAGSVLTAGSAIRSLAVVAVAVAVAVSRSVSKCRLPPFPPFHHQLPRFWGLLLCGPHSVRVVHLQ